MTYKSLILNKFYLQFLQDFAPTNQMRALSGSLPWVLWAR